MLLQALTKALLLRYTCGCDAVAFSVFGAKDGNWDLPVACCVLQPVLLLLSMFKAAPSTVYENNP